MGKQRPRRSRGSVAFKAPVDGSPPRGFLGSTPARVRGDTGGVTTPRAVAGAWSHATEESELLRRWQHLLIQETPTPAINASAWSASRTPRGWSAGASPRTSATQPAQLGRRGGRPSHEAIDQHLNYLRSFARD